MRILVQKYGGTSVKNLTCMRQVLAKVQKTLTTGANNTKLIVVLSAMSGETDRLLNLAQDWSEQPDLAELDSMVSTGEQISAALFSMLCKDAGIRARSLLSFQVPIYTNANHGRARIEFIDSVGLKKLFYNYDVLVIAGFQGITTAGRITTLGRGGSDTSAVALAAILDADRCEIYTDVDGVYTTDPTICSTARKLDRISYDEMLEMASMGAKVLQIRSVEFAKKYNVPVYVRSTFSDIPGTLVTKEDIHMESAMVSGIAYDKNQARVTLRDVPDKPGIAAAIFSPLASADILVDMIIQNTSEGGLTDITFTVSRENLDRAIELLNGANKEIKAREISHDLNVTKVSIIGVGMRNHSGIAAIAFQALKNDNINIMMISTSEIKITCLIQERYAELAVRTLHEALGLDKTTPSGLATKSSSITIKDTAPTGQYVRWPV
ncbi:Aspartate kinase Ask_LysC [Desulfovibrionales bacterium]